MDEAEEKERERKVNSVMQSSGRCFNSTVGNLSRRASRSPGAVAYHLANGINALQI